MPEDPTRIYLDHNASTPIAPAVSAAMRPLLDEDFGNPSSGHWAGRPARDAVGAARRRIASLLGCDPAEIVLTSGGSEANNQVIKGVVLGAASPPHIVTTAVEHPAILEPCRFVETLGARVTAVPVDGHGLVDPDDVRRAIAPDTALVSVMHANNEVGTVQPIAEIAHIARDHGVLFHTDAAQSAGKIPVRVRELGVDLLSLAGHKLYAPKGVGALFVRRGVELTPLVHGGGHEDGRRAGTESALLAAGLGAACRLAETDPCGDRQRRLRDRLWNGLRARLGDRILLNGHPTLRLPNTLNVGFTGRYGDEILAQMPEIAASTGSACHTGERAISPVLAAMGIPPAVGHGAVRFSVGRGTTEADVDAAAERMRGAGDGRFQHPVERVPRRAAGPRAARRTTTTPNGLRGAGGRFQHPVGRVPRRATVPAQRGGRRRRTDCGVPVMAASSIRWEEFRGGRPVPARRGGRPVPVRRGGRPPAPGAAGLLAAAVLAAAPLAGCAPGDREAGALPPTRAERTGYEQTTGYGEVVQFVTLAAEGSDRIHATTFGSTVEGRPLPLAVVGDTADARPASVIDAGRLRVWLQGAIHGGEVAGKEALLMLLRDLAGGAHAAWSSSMTLLVAPIYNADGHERMGPDTRPYQFGPFAGQGERTNAQGLDLNRDHMKLESPEARALARAYEAYDPHVVIDLHTTNGTEHAYHLTYSPPLHPNTHPAIDALLRDEWLPAITRAVEQSDGWRFYYYGNLPPAAGTEPSWRTFDHRPRFNNNYVGLRNRVALLGEAYAYAPFDERVHASLRFVEEALTFAHDRAGAIAALVETADAAPVAGARLATRAVPVPSAGPVEILLGRTEEVQNPYTRAPMRRRLDVAQPTPMHEYGTFAAAEDGDELAPAAYYVPADLTAVVDLLAAHGVDGAPLAADTMLDLQEFVVRASSVADRPFQGHRERLATGDWTPVERVLPAGTLVVPVDQPLGRLLFALLEPRSDDGIVNWNLVDDHVTAAGSVYPILRRPAAPGATP